MAFARGRPAVACRPPSKSPLDVLPPLRRPSHTPSSPPPSAAPESYRSNTSTQHEMDDIEKNTYPEEELPKQPPTPDVRRSRPLPQHWQHQHAARDVQQPQA